jgi:hypothetical protein
MSASLNLREIDVGWRFKSVILCKVSLTLCENMNDRKPKLGSVLLSLLVIPYIHH